MRLTRTTVVDEVVVDGETVVMVDEQVMLLGPLAARVLAILGAEERPASYVRETVFAEFGVPADPEAAWRALLAELVARRLVRVEE
ncbi:MAG: hypothetical protein FWE71_05945 [Nocardioidaceae bacterium]|nr:hypothetical protein [Nocardioidaceae bacterium]MCL2613025.1 hypothetical protein [Nocardioidaceae bacterium]